MNFSQPPLATCIPVPAYLRAVRRFLDWCARFMLTQITPEWSVRISDHLPGSTPTRKAAIWPRYVAVSDLWYRHVSVLIRAARSRRASTSLEGQDPGISIDRRRLITRLRRQACQRTKNAGGSTTARGDRLSRISSGFATGASSAAIYTAARPGAVARLRRRHFVYDGSMESAAVKRPLFFPISDNRIPDRLAPSKGNDNYFSRSGRQSALPCGPFPVTLATRRVKRSRALRGRNPTRDTRPTGCADGAFKAAPATEWSGAHFRLSDQSYALNSKPGAALRLTPFPAAWRSPATGRFARARLDVLACLLGLARAVARQVSSMISCVDQPVDRRRVVIGP